MSLAQAITQTMQAHGLTTAQVAVRMGENQDRATFYRMVNGATTEPRLGTLVRLCIALGTTPSELLELAGVWSPQTPGRAGWTRSHDRRTLWEEILPRRWGNKDNLA